GPHLEHARAYLPELGDAGVVMDLGSGGGVPGLVLAHDRPQPHVVLPDAMETRCRVLEWAVDALDLHNTHLKCGRAEERARDPELRGKFGLVVARSFAAPPVLAECAAGFLRVGGRLVVSEPPVDAAARGSEERWPEQPLEDLGLRAVTLRPAEA